MLRSLLPSPKNRQKQREHARDANPAPPPLAELATQFPDATPEELELIQAARTTTMTSPERIIGLIRAVDYVVRSRIPGDIVECGVWRGGSMLVAARTLLARNDHQRTLWLYDTFEGMSEPTAADVDLRGETANHLLLQHDPHDHLGVWCLSRREEVEQTMQSSGYAAEHIRYVEGKVEDTLPNRRPESIALLRLDTDWYESTRCELEYLFPLLSPGGVLIIDDYGHWRGCRQAVDDYFAATGQPIHLARMDYTGRIGIKLPPI